MTSGRPILTLKGVIKPAALSAPSGVMPAQTAVKGPETAAGIVRAGEDIKPVMPVLRPLEPLLSRRSRRGS